MPMHSITPFGTPYIVSGDGPCAVLLHGLGLDQTIWTGAAALLSAHCKVITYDLLGHGGAPAPERYTVDPFIDQLAEVTRHLSVDTFHLVGFSFGAAIAVRAAGLLGATSLVLISMPFERAPEERATSLQGLSDLRRLGTALFADHAVQRWFTPDFLIERREVAERIRRLIASMDIGRFRHLYALSLGLDRVPNLDATIPTLLMTGSADTTCPPRMVQALLAHLPNADAAVVGGAGHMLVVERPDDVAGAIQRFVARHD